jgi:hypothetical protein
LKVNRLLRKNDVAAVGDVCLDTAKIAQKVEALLDRNGATRKRFGDEILGLCQPQVSELLRHPFKWEKCSEMRKGWYRTMNEWAESEENIAQFFNKK